MAAASPAAAPSSITRRLDRARWAAIPAVTALLSLTLIVVPSVSAQKAIGATIAVTLTIVMAVGVWRVQGTARSIWFAILAMTVFAAIGNILHLYPVLDEQWDLPIGSGDAAWLLAYGCGVIAVMWLMKRLHPGYGDEAWADTLILFLSGVAFFAFYVLGEDYLDTHYQTDPIGLFYPLFALLVLAALLRIIFGSTRWNLSIWLVVAALGCGAVSNLTHEAGLWQTRWSAPEIVAEIAILIGISLLAAAPFARGADTIDLPENVNRDPEASKRLAWLSVGALSAPLLIAYVSLNSEPTTAMMRVLAVIVFATTSLVVIRIHKLFVRVEAQSVALEEQARTDALTGLPNRRTLDAHLHRLEEDPEREFTVAMLDLDHFKRYNDTHGHKAADELLEQVALLWTSVFASPHFLARYGGEEFTAVVESADEAEVVAMFEKARAEMPGGETVSIGYAVRGRGERAAETMRRADSAMYMAKRAGRDRVCGYSSDVAV